MTISRWMFAAAIVGLAQNGCTMEQATPGEGDDSAIVSTAQQSLINQDMTWYEAKRVNQTGDWLADMPLMASPAIFSVTKDIFEVYNWSEDNMLMAVAGQAFYTCPDTAGSHDGHELRGEFLPSPEVDT